MSDKKFECIMFVIVQTLCNSIKKSGSGLDFFIRLKLAIDKQGKRFIFYQREPNGAQPIC